ncbi:TetR/AcrR family transcriptional regulator [Streptomyces sp. CAI-21]|uniref:TetR/AcrR family transcriptional regulator n=1 Tax=Streptomyces TaxID=1883 RepID=UPI0004CA43FD|nr:MULTISPECIES: TetR/AcrR family transcriptional regulator [Streptomyces]MBO1283415.1 TetR/AcrR family transcriptional regulator [Streptomyces sampsonii]NUW08662.1 TetR/AcrR family transcriptional regulator [Streptomyces sp. CAI-21]RZF04128.1 TetR/AcrR family transcriptional regulator [Streptomyces albidoflavus]
MPRWKPDAGQRLVMAAFELFAEQGYDGTTVSQIATRAGLTRSTFHRHFSDKRDILTAGQATLSRLLTDGIAAAPATATPVEAVARGLERASAGMTAFNRELSPLMRAALDADEELREREALKSVGMARAMAEALRARDVPDPAAQVAAELGVLAFKTGYGRWAGAAQDEAPGGLPALTVAALRELHAAATRLT